MPENLDKGYHGYWTKNIYSLNSNFGTADDLKQLSQALHDKQMVYSFTIQSHTICIVS